MNEHFEPIGRRLRFLIERRGVGHGQLAQAIGVDAPRLSKLLSGRDPFTIEYLDPIVQALGESDDELHHLQALHSLGKWRIRLQSLTAVEEFGRFGVAPERLAPHMIRLAEQLAYAERVVDPAFSAERLLIKHLNSLHVVISSVVTALREIESPIFNEQNIATHLRFPANYYVAALLNLSDQDFAGGGALSETVQRLVDEVVEGGAGWTFMERLMRHHAHHVKARYSRVAAGPEALSAKERKDIHVRRMTLIGAALRDEATERAWSSLFDALEEPEFRAAVLAFDTCHYGDGWIERDGLQPRPTQIRRTALRYFAALLSPDPNLQLFAAKRLLTLLDNATPAMLREADLAGEARRVADATDQRRPAEATQSLNRIKRIDDDK